jgi:hypothetical protein
MTGFNVVWGSNVVWGTTSTEASESMGVAVNGEQ